MRHSSRNNQDGITLVEILVVITILSTLIFLIFTVLFDFLKSNYSIMGATVQTNDTRSALHMIESDVSTSIGFASEPTISDPISYAWRWTGYPSPSETSRVLITKNYATTKAKSDPTRELVFSRASDCTAGLVNNNIYYVHDSNLYRRTIVDPETAGGRCGSEPAQKQTCRADQSNAACRAGEALIASNVTEFKVDYFAQPTDAAPIANAYSTSTPYDISTVKTAVITLSTSARSNGTTNSHSGNIRITVD